MRRAVLSGIWLSLWTGCVLAAEPSALALHDGYVREMPPGHPVSAAFGHLVNGSDASVTVVEAQCECADRVEIHRQIEAGGRARMEQLQSLEVPVGGVELAPGGVHLMLIDLNRPLRAGDEVTLTLIDAAGGTYSAQLPVRRLSGVEGGQVHHHH